MTPEHAKARAADLRRIHRKMLGIVSNGALSTEMRYEVAVIMDHLKDLAAEYDERAR